MQEEIRIGKLLVNDWQMMKQYSKKLGLANYWYINNWQIISKIFSIYQVKVKTTSLVHF